MISWIAGLLKFISPAEAQRAHIALLDAQIHELHSLVDNQRGTINELRAENENLKSQIPEPKKEVAALEHNHRLEELREKILAIVSQNDRLHDAEIADIARVSKQLATLHLHELRSANLVRSSFAIDDDSYEVTVWFVEQLGRKYLHDHGLL